MEVAHAADLGQRWNVFLGPLSLTPSASQKISHSHLIPCLCLSCQVAPFRFANPSPSKPIGKLQHQTHSHPRRVLTEMPRHTCNQLKRSMTLAVELRKYIGSGSQLVRLCCEQCHIQNIYIQAQPHPGQDPAVRPALEFGDRNNMNCLILQTPSLWVTEITRFGKLQTAARDKPAQPNDAEQI